MNSVIIISIWNMDSTINCGTLAISAAVMVDIGSHHRALCPADPHIVSGGPKPSPHNGHPETHERVLTLCGDLGRAFTTPNSQTRDSLYTNGSPAPRRPRPACRRRLSDTFPSNTLSFHDI